MSALSPVIRLHPQDDVVIARRQLVGGEQVPEENLTVAGLIPPAKVATRAIAKGEPVRRYNQIIGVATQDIAAGQHVHTQNLAMAAFSRDYAFCVDAKPTEYVAEPATFQGIVRADGRVATHNYIGILSSVNCSATVVRAIADHFRRDFNPTALAAYPNVDGVVALTHSGGCGIDPQGPGLALLRRTLAGYARHPNFAAVLMVGLGCETNQIGYAEPVTAQGFVFMDTPGYDPTSATGQVAGGANLVCFTTGRGSAYGCQPTPSLKLVTNTALWQRQEEDMDINCGDNGTVTIAEVGARIFQMMLDCASGQPLKSELHGYSQNEFVPWPISVVT